MYGIQGRNYPRLIVSGELDFAANRPWGGSDQHRDLLLRREMSGERRLAVDVISLPPLLSALKTEQIARSSIPAVELFSPTRLPRCAL
ncbi:hypothetical protein EI94DRAFT_1755338 [Lactarius quietus]|nr:hypothetical protein EI94DRAFT_1755338 [Lactarius quietus]